MAMDVTVSQLRAFEAVAATLHFGRAADQLGVTQPTVSKEIRRLEHAVGVPLFHRSAGGTTLTHAGERLRPHAADVLAQLRSFDTAAAVARRERRGEVTIAASPSIVNHLLPETLRAIDDQELGITLQALEVETGEVLAAVESGHADLGIGHLIGDPGRAVKRRLGQDELRVVLHRSLVPTRTSRIDVRNLANLPLLLWPRERNPRYYDHLMELCRARGLEPLVLTGTSRISGSWRFFLEDARAFSLVPADFARQEGWAEVASYPLDPPGYVPLEVAWNRDSSAEVRRILEIVVDLTGDRRKP